MLWRALGSGLSTLQLGDGCLACCWLRCAVLGLDPLVRRLLSCSVRNTARSFVPVAGMG